MSVGKGLSSRLRQRVDIQEKNQVANGVGGRRPRAGEDRWKTIASAVAAEVLPLRGGEALNAAIERATQFYRVTVRNRSDLSTSKRLVWNGVPLNIRTCPPPTNGSELVMTCESGVPG